MSLQIKMAANLFDNHFSQRESLEYSQARQEIDEHFMLTTENDNFTPLEHSEKREILKVLSKHKFHKVEASRELGVSLNTLKSKMRKYNLKISKEKALADTLLEHDEKQKMLS